MWAAAAADAEASCATFQLAARAADTLGGGPDPPTCPGPCKSKRGCAKSEDPSFRQSEREPLDPQAGAKRTGALALSPPSPLAECPRIAGAQSLSIHRIVCRTLRKSPIHLFGSFSSSPDNTPSDPTSLA